VYSDPDANGLHVRTADEAVCVGPALSSKSYLNIPRIIQAIEESGSQAVHPGYGFLSENSHFVGELEKRNITFIGPSAYAMDALGDKIHSKKLALNAGVRTVPGYVGEIPDAEEAVRISREIGYPVMIKASAGGGGKGMRIAYTDDEARLGYRLSKQEAASSFSDDRIFVEKYVEHPRHIEIQLIADKHGNVCPLPERECTIQRRNQKVIEESPSPFLTPATRKAMQDQAAMLAKAVGYSSAGTVEFLVDKNQNFYFLEMNTRLQVEHPVTEAVTGVDLVELMIRVAAGEPLPTHMIGAPMPIRGHAFESRVYAEDPFRGFLPSTGRLSRYIEPQTFADRDPYLSPLNNMIRADSGIVQGSEISMYYDPMICKLITHAENRADALDKMRAALDAYVVRGLGHNISFLRALCAHPRFMAGDMSTAFIKEEYPEGFKGVKLNKEEELELIASSAIMHAIRSFADSELSGRSEAVPMPDVSHVIVTLGTVTVEDGHPPAFDVKLSVEPMSQELEHSSPSKHGDGSLWTSVITNLQTKETSVIRLANVDWPADSPVMFASVVDVDPSAPVSKHTVRVQQAESVGDGHRMLICGAAVDVYVRSPLAHALAQHMLPKIPVDVSKFLIAPMPGTLISLNVKVGDTVEEGQEIAIVEAMKMQNVLRAPKKCKVKNVCGKAGDVLVVDQHIVEFE
jgi:propionyl-CoA carboxylase alpha chain